MGPFAVRSVWRSIIRAVMRVDVRRVAVAALRIAITRIASRL